MKELFFIGSILGIVLIIGCSMETPPVSGKTVLEVSQSNVELTDLKCKDILPDKLISSLFSGDIKYDAEHSVYNKVLNIPKCDFTATDNSISGGFIIYENGESDYLEMLEGAKIMVGDNEMLKETNSIGKLSFEHEDPFVNKNQLGFLTSDGRYAVLVTLVFDQSSMNKARTIAQEINSKLS